MNNTPIHTLHRIDGPETSKEAAESLKNLNNLEKEVYTVIEYHGSSGCISDQVRESFPNLSYSSVTARYKALSDKGWISYTGTKKPGNSGRNQRVMISTKFL